MTHQVQTQMVDTIPWRGTKKPSHRMLLLILWHISAHHLILRVKQLLRQCFCQLMFAQGRGMSQWAGWADLSLLVIWLQLLPQLPQLHPGPQHACGGDQLTQEGAASHPGPVFVLEYLSINSPPARPQQLSPWESFLSTLKRFSHQPAQHLCILSLIVELCILFLSVSFSKDCN
jgi:hypothetical protein